MKKKKKGHDHSFYNWWRDIEIVLLDSREYFIKYLYITYVYTNTFYSLFISGFGVSVDPFLKQG